MSRPAIDITGQQFGRLTAVRRNSLAERNNGALWNCFCNPKHGGCGNEYIADGSDLRSGKVRSCGCLQKDANTKHGLSISPEYKVWSNMIERCTRESLPNYSDYGGRGITVCEEWRDSFEAFYRDMGPRPSPEHSLDRRENDKGYSKENCRWATRIQQNNNTRRNVLYELDGKKRTLPEWCRELGLSYLRIKRLVQRKGMELKDVINAEPSNKHRKCNMINNYLEYVSLCSKLAEYHRIYHTENISPIPDEEYDRLRKDVIRWETENPDKILEISPVFKVGAIKPENKKDELRHEYRMLSLENALDADEAQSWINLWTSKYGEELKIIGEFKYDGLALSLLYIDGTFTRALTRGDGEYGEDVTRHAAVFVPDKIEAPGTVEIRGEAFIKKAWLEFMNSGAERFANSRNAVAGLFNRKEPGKFHQGITFVPYDLEGADFVFNSYSDKLEVLKQLNFQLLSCFVLQTPHSIQEVFEQVTEIRSKGDIPFDIDGMVFKIDDGAKQTVLGESNHSPRWAFAYKFPPVTGRAKLLDVVFQIGRTGEVAPVAKITATPLMGVIVTSVLLHNEERMRERNIAIGNTYEVWRSGDVIPHMGNMVESVPDAKPVSFPECCPSCGTRLVKRGATYYCDNSARCPAQTKAGIAYAVSRDMLNIDGLAEQTIELMLNAGLIERTADIFELNTSQLSTLEGYTEYSAGKLEGTIRRARETTFDRFIACLGILEVGKTTARKLAQRLFKHEVLFELDTPEKVLELKVPDIGPSTAASIANYFANPQKRQDALDLYKYLIIPEMGEAQPVEGVVGKTFVFTGKFSDTREAYENRVLAAGGHVSGSISPKTDYLVAGERAGSKLRKAKLLGVDIMDERTFLSFFEPGQNDVH